MIQPDNSSLSGMFARYLMGYDALSAPQSRQPGFAGVAKLTSIESFGGQMASGGRRCEISEILDNTRVPVSL